MTYDVIFILGEKYLDHPLCGIALLKRYLEKNNFTVGVIETPKHEKEITKLGKPNLFFGISSGAIDSMLRNYTALKKPREEADPTYKKEVPDKAVLVYSNWIKKYFKDSIMVLGGVEASLRRFSHYDYWEDELKKSILLSSRANILVYGYGEKQCLEIANRIKNKQPLEGIEGTCIRSRELPENFILLPSHEEIFKKEKFCEMQNLLDSNKNLAQKTDTFYILQYKFPLYTSKDLDEYYEMPFTRKVTVDYMKGFEFSVVTHRGCIGNCNFCSLRLMSDGKIVSRSEESILREIKYITKLPHFKGNIDDLGGPSANMYGMDCRKCALSNCINCDKLDKSHSKLIHLLREIRKIKEVKRLYVRSGIRYDLVNDEYLKELKPHIAGKLKIAPEHISKNVLSAMNKTKGNLDDFIKRFKELKCGELSYYFMVAHPGSTMKDAEELSRKIKTLKNAEAVQIFTPTPMTVSTCMYYTGLEPKTNKPLFIPRTYKDKKDQKRILELDAWKKEK